MHLNAKITPQGFKKQIINHKSALSKWYEKK